MIAVMRRLEFPAFLVVAVGLHLLFWPKDWDGGAQSSGGQGAAQIALAAAPAALRDQVAEWENTPDLAPVPVMQAMAVPPNITPPNLPPRPDMPRLAMPELGRLPVVMRRPDTARPPDISQMALSPLPPPVSPAPAPRQSPRPMARPLPPPPAAPSPPSPATQAATGAGQNLAAGQTDAAPAATSSRPTSPERLAQWGAQIRTAIERRKRYPRGVSARGIVRLALTVSTTGQLISYRVTAGSGHPALDEAARAAVQNARLPRARSGVEAGQYDFQIALSFAP
jgi:protein TonB